MRTKRGRSNVFSGAAKVCNDWNTFIGSQTNVPPKVFGFRDITHPGLDDFDFAKYYYSLELGDVQDFSIKFVFSAMK